MKKKTLKLLLISMLAVSMFMVGCNKSSDTASKSGESKGKAAKDTLVFARGGDSTSLDPITTTEGEAFRVTDNIYEALLNYGESDTTIEPGLAEKWEVSDDALTYTFHLREGVKFHDGTDFNAEAVVKNFERWMNGDADKFPYYTMFGGFKKDEGHIIKEVKAVDAKTVQFVLKTPSAPFIKNLAMSPFGIASPAAIEKYGDELRANPVGTGPFKFKEWVENDRITLEKNEDYWMEGYPKLKQVIFKVIPENSARLNALSNGEIDLMVGVNNADEKSITGNDKLQIFKRPSMNVGYLGFQTTKKPFDNKLVRQALSHAIDKQSIIDAFYGGQAVPAATPIPPSMEGHNDAVEDYPFDLEKAKELLAEAGYPDGFETDLWAMPVARDYMPEAAKVAEVIQENLSKIGVKTKIQSVEWATYLDKAAKGELDFYLLGWTGDNGDADNFLYTLLDKDSIGSNNYSYYSNDKLHDILIQAQKETDPAKRNDLYKEAQVIVHEDAPWVPLVHSTPLIAGASDLVNYVPHPTGTEALTKVEFKK